LRRTIPIVEEELSLLVEGERWWGEEIRKPKITFEQNLLVKTVVTEYLKRRESVTTPSESIFPESDFINNFKVDYPDMEDDVKDNWNVSGEEDESEDEEEESIVEEGAEEGLNQPPPPEEEQGEEKPDQLSDDTEVILEETVQEPTTEPDYTLLT